MHLSVIEKERKKFLQNIVVLKVFLTIDLLQVTHLMPKWHHNVIINLAFLLH